MTAILFGVWTRVQTPDAPLAKAVGSVSVLAPE
jgi:hypothetical protein